MAAAVVMVRETTGAGQPEESEGEGGGPGMRG